LSDLKKSSGRRPISTKAGKIECTNPENAEIPLVRSQKKSTFLKNCPISKIIDEYETTKTDRNGKTGSKKKKYTKKLCSISTKLGEIGRFLLVILIFLKPYINVRNRLVRGRPECDFPILGRVPISPWKNIPENPEERHPP